MIHFARYTSVDQQLFTFDCSLISYNDALCFILSQATSRTWWKHIDPFWPTFSCVPHSSLFPLHWRSSKPYQPCCLTHVLAESIQEHWVRHSHPTALGFPDPRHHYHAIHRIHLLPHTDHRSQLDNTSHRSSDANSQCRKKFQEYYPNHFLWDDGRFFCFSRQLIHEFILQEGHL